MKLISILFFSLCAVTVLAQAPDSSAAAASPASEAIVPATIPASSDSLGAAPVIAVSPDSSETVVSPAPYDSASASTVPPPAPSGGTLSPAYAKALQKANELFRDRAYAEAIPYYEKARQFDPGNKMVLANLAESYRLTNNVTGEVNSYGELVRNGLAEPKDELYYAQALMKMGESEKARPFLEKYTADPRGKEIASSFGKQKAYTKNMDAYQVNIAPFNSLQNDLCAVKFNDIVVFASTREKTSWIKRQQGWTNGNYLALYSTEMNGSTEPMPFMRDLDSKYNDGPICFSRDYNTVYFTRNNSRKAELAKDGTYKLKIFEAALDENGFSMVRPLPFAGNDYNYAHPSISEDGHTLYFASDMEGGKGGMDIYSVRRDSSGNWGEPVNLGDAVNTAGNEVFPFMADSGMFYFASDGHDGLGGLDLYEAPLKNGQVKKIFNMGEPVNTRFDDFGIYLFDGNRSGYITSNRKAGGMDDDIYTLQILRTVKHGKEATLIAKDKDSGEPLADTKLVVNGDTVMTNEKGEYALSLEDEGNYRITALRKDYYNAEDSLNAQSSEEDSFTRDLPLEKDPQTFLRGLITDAKTNELLEGVTVKLMDVTSNTETDSYTTTSSGDYFKFLFGSHIGDQLTYLIKLEKPGYLPRTMIFSHTIDKPGEINLNDHLNLSLGKVAVGMDLAKMIDLKPIYFDMGKSDIRQDAALELDKIVQVMNEYPNMSIELGSHTDCRSSAASNLKLSAARAKNSAAYIVKKGISKSRITAKGYGETKILNNCFCEGSMESSCPEEEHAKNRRTEFLITRLK